MVLMYGLMRICRPKAKKKRVWGWGGKLNNYIIGTQTRTDCQCCIAYQVVKCEGEHDEIVWNTTKSHCNQSLLTQQWGSLPPARRWSSASPDSLISHSFQHQRAGRASLPLFIYAMHFVAIFWAINWSWSHNPWIVTDCYKYNQSKKIIYTTTNHH